MNIIDPGGKYRTISPPDSHAELTDIAIKALKRAGVYGTIPTPWEALYESDGLTLLSEQAFTDRSFAFLKSLPAGVRRKALHGVNKLRGAVNHRTRVVWIPKQHNPRFEKLPKFHEWGHGIISWHFINGAHLDDNETLSPEVRILMEREANFIGAEGIFQAGLFRERALSLTTSLHSALKLADDHEATYASTMWKYVESMDTPVGLLIYSDSHVLNTQGRRQFKLKQTNMSVSFSKKFEKIEPPKRVDETSPFGEVLSPDVHIAEGECRLGCGGEEHVFEWEAWTNSYSLFVLLRSAPRPGRLGGILRPFQRSSARSTSVA